MEKEINKQHVQVPNDMTEQNNSLKPGDLLIYATIKRHMSIQNLINTNYIEVTPKGRGKLYRFLKWEEFEPFSYNFLDNKKLSFKEKAYILATQQYMFKNKDTQNGIVTYNNIELSKRINTSPSTISRLDSSLKEKEFLDINVLTQKDQETGLPIREKVFHLSKIEQAIVFILGNHEERIQENTNEIQLLKERMDKLENENKKLKEKLKNR